MTDAYFVAAGPGQFEPTPHVVGPWSDQFMHGGPPSALLAHEIVAGVPNGSGPPSPLLTRMTVEFLRPVPVAPLTITVDVVRPGRRVALVDAVLSSGGEPVLLARAWLSRREHVDVPDSGATSVPAPAPLKVMDHSGWSGGYLRSIEWGWVDGAFEAPGPATAWSRCRFPLIEDVALQPVERVLLVADSGSGLSAVVPPGELIFVNTDLTVHLTRPPVGDMVWMRAQSTLDPDGVGLATTVLGDQTGQIGVAAQSLFVAPVK